MKKSIAKILIFTLLFNISSPIFSATTSTEPKEYTEDEFPQALHDLRRFEIVSLGALPFVTLNSTLVYSGVKYVQNDFNPAYAPNPFAPKSESGFTTEEQVGILLTSLGISVGIGLTDYIIQVVKRNSKKNKAKKLNQNIKISTIENDPTATKIEINTESSEQISEESKTTEITEEQNIESAASEEITNQIDIITPELQEVQ